MKKLIVLSLLLASTNAFAICNYMDDDYYECQRQERQAQEAERERAMMQIQIDAQRDAFEREQRERERREAVQRNHERKCNYQYGYDA